MEFPNTKNIPLEQVKNLLSTNRGIYFWFDVNDNSIVYIGIANGVGGLKRRIGQHLNPKYLEPRSEKQHTSKDAFQLSHAIIKNDKKAIDKSSFRKSIGRMLNLKPGDETVEYIRNNLRLEIFESDDKEHIENMEKEFIKRFKPKFNNKGC